jgi:hypothetical protein
MAWKRDIFAICLNGPPTQRGYLNHLNSNIKLFTEQERNFQLSFLDVLVIHHPNSLGQLIYKKLTHTGKYLHTDSHNPLAQKIHHHY